MGSGGQEGRAPPRSWGQPPGQPQHGEVRAESPAPGLGGGERGGTKHCWGVGGGHNLPGGILGLGGPLGAEKEQPGKSKGREAGRGGPAAEPDGKGAFCPKIARARPGWGR